MKKFTKKILVAIVAIMAVVCLSVSLAACGETTAKSTGFYSSSNKHVTYANFQPKYNLYTLTLYTETIETFNDNTYCLTVNSVAISNVNFGEDTKSLNCDYAGMKDEDKEFIIAGQENWEASRYNDKDDITTKYYGTYEVVKESETSKTIKLQVPTSVFYAKKGDATHYDTANWTETMAGEDNTTAEDYLAGKVSKFESAGIEVYITVATSGFEIITAIL